jgi:hypothetical protein
MRRLLMTLVLASACADGLGDEGPPPASMSSIRMPWELQVVSDGTWVVDGTLPAAPVRSDCRASVWPQLPPAQWIWRAPCEAGARESRSFLKTFALPDRPALARLEMRVDDYAYVSLNDRALPNECLLDMGTSIYGPAALCGFQMPYVREVGELLQAGDNTIRVMVHNIPFDTPTGGTDPAGLLVRLTLQGVTSASGRNSTPPRP